MESKATRGYKGSPRIGKAAELLVKNDNLKRIEALRLAGYSKKDSKCRKRLINLSVRKTRLQKQSIAERVQLSPRKVATRTLVSASPISVPSPKIKSPPKLVDVSESTVSSISTCDSQSLLSRKKRKSSTNYPYRAKILSSDSRRTPSQLMSVLRKKKEADKKKKKHTSGRLIQ